MAIVTIYSPLEECSDVVIVPERNMLDPFKRASFDKSFVFRRSISGQFNVLAEVLHAQHPLKYNRTADGRRVETYYRVDDLRKKLGQGAYDQELALVIADMDEAQRLTRHIAELRIVKNNSYHRLAYEFHKDRDDRLMCCYSGPTTEFIRQEHGIPHVENGFTYYMKEEGAPVFHFNVGDLWLQAGYARGLKHRAAEIGESDPPRMLMVC